METSLLHDALHDEGGRGNKKGCETDAAFLFVTAGLQAAAPLT
jgi:hypothetical protein